MTDHQNSSADSAALPSTEEQLADYVYSIQNYTDAKEVAAHLWPGLNAAQPSMERGAAQDLARLMQSLGYVEFADCLSFDAYNLIVTALETAQPPAATVETEVADLRCLVATYANEATEAKAELESLKRCSAGSEPVAWTNEAQLGFLKDPELVAMPMAMWGKPNGAARIPLYTAQPQGARK